MEGGLNAAASSPLAAAIIALGSSEFPERLLDFLQRIADADASMILRYWPDRVPEVLADRLDPKERPYLYGDYLAGVYRLSPFYRLSAGLEGAAPGATEGDRARRISARANISAATSRASASAISPACCCRLQAEGVVHLSFAQEREAGRLRPPRAGRVTANCFPSLPRWLSGTGEMPGEGAGAMRAASPLEIMRVEFDLTRRETEIAETMLAGHSSKSMARLLAISAETVKVHRRNLYAKLGIASQAELFSLFLAQDWGVATPSRVWRMGCAFA